MMPFDDPVRDVGWSVDRGPDGPEDPLGADEMLWLDVALWRRVGSTATMSLEWADGFLTALAAGPGARAALGVPARDPGCRQDAVRFAGTRKLHRGDCWPAISHPIEDLLADDERSSRGSTR